MEFSSLGWQQQVMLEDSSIVGSLVRAASCSNPVT